MMLILALCLSFGLVNNHKKSEWTTVSMKQSMCSLIRRLKGWNEFHWNGTSFQSHTGLHPLPLTSMYLAILQSLGSFSRKKIPPNGSVVGGRVVKINSWVCVLNLKVTIHSTPPSWFIKIDLGLTKYMDMCKHLEIAFWMSQTSLATVKMVKHSYEKGCLHWE